LDKLKSVKAESSCHLVFSCTERHRHCSQKKGAALPDTPRAIGARFAFRRYRLHCVGEAQVVVGLVVGLGRNPEPQCIRERRDGDIDGVPGI